MFTREELTGSWNRVKGRLQEQWGQLTDDDLQSFQGNAEQLIGKIQQKTGATRRDIESFITNTLHEASSVKDQVTQTAREYASTAMEAIEDGYGAVQRKSGEFSRQVATTVSHRPLESLAIVFGVGLLAGVMLSMSRRS